ncbi:MAG TPA: thiamine pyrophosphate-dependent enzyme [Candidatus Angelobacter sp.]
MADNRRTTSVSSKPGKTNKLPAPHGSQAAPSPVLNTSKLRALYAALVKGRMLQQRFPAGSAPGEEAVLVGGVFDLKPEDCIVPSQRSVIADLVRGEPLAKVLSMHAEESKYLPSAALQMGLGAGLALAFKMRQQHQIALALGGEELIGEAAWEEAMAFAGANKLPIVYVISHSGAQDLRAAAQRNQVPGITVDGADVVAVHRVLQESIRRARQGHGPTLVEATLEGKDPVLFMEAYLKTRDLWSDTWRDRVEEDCKKELDRGLRTAHQATGA